MRVRYDENEKNIQNIKHLCLTQKYPKYSMYKSRL
jgi:hypothetical protein